MNATAENIEDALEWQNAFLLVELKARNKGMTPAEFAKACLNGIESFPLSIRDSIGVVRHQTERIAQDLPEAAEGLKCWLRQWEEPAQ